MLRSPLKQILAVVALIFLLAIAALFAAQSVKDKKNSNDKKSSGSAMSSEKANTKNPVLATPQSITAGEKIYTQYCKQCHGDRAIRDSSCVCTPTFCPANLRNPHLWKDGEGFVYWTLQEGRAPMPSFRGKLTDRQCWDVVNYLHSLAKEKIAQEDKD